ncbi:hypothetical protein X729_01615 [Mesorhizobium sp. L103C131B0]|nr:hypothetical protein X729_01615 [Mesorhizobium sp. L103C131B0]
MCSSGRRLMSAAVVISRLARKSGETTGITVSRINNVESASGQSGWP